MQVFWRTDWRHQDTLKAIAKERVVYCITITKWYHKKTYTCEPGEGVLWMLIIIATPTRLRCGGGGGPQAPAHVPFPVRRMGVTYNVPTPLEISFQGKSRYNTTPSCMSLDYEIRDRTRHLCRAVFLERRSAAISKGGVCGAKPCT